MGDRKFELARSALNELLGRWPALERKLAWRFGVLLVGYLLEGPYVLSGCSHEACLELLGKARWEAAAVLAVAQKLAEELACQEAARARPKIIGLLDRLRGEEFRAAQQFVRGDFPRIDLKRLWQLRESSNLPRYIAAQGADPGNLLRSLRRARLAFENLSFGQLSRVAWVSGLSTFTAPL